MRSTRTIITAIATLGLSLGIGHTVAQEATLPWEKATAYPDRITLSVTETPSTSQTVTWRTDASVAEAFAEIAVADGSPAFSGKSSRVDAVTESLELNRFRANLDQVAHYHAARFTDLEPDMLYAYRVGSEAGWSEWFQFRTASAELAPFSFVYVGDAQNGILSHWSRLIRTAYQRDPNVDLMLHAGDLVNVAHLDAEWGEWFKGLGWISGQVPFIAVPGNHEYSRLNDEGHLAIQWQGQFEFPRVEGFDEAVQETIYSVDYQGVRFIALNSLRDRERQTEWLETVLSDNPNRWTVAMFHYPIFATGVNRDNLALRRAWKPLFDKYEVDLVLQGHDHTYGRGAVARDESEFIRSVYVNSVSGRKMYSVKEDRWAGYAEDGVVMARSAENTQLFQWIHVDDEEIQYEARMATGELYDAFTLSKDAEGRKTLTEDPIVNTPERRFSNTLTDQ